MAMNGFSGEIVVIQMWGSSEAGARATLARRLAVWILSYARVENHSSSDTTRFAPLARVRAH